MERIKLLYPQLNLTKAPKDDERTERLRKFTVESPEAKKEIILRHPSTQGSHFEVAPPEPGEALFERHRTLYQWLMSSDESIAINYVASLVPNPVSD